MTSFSFFEEWRLSNYLTSYRNCFAQKARPGERKAAATSQKRQSSKARGAGDAAMLHTMSKQNYQRRTFRGRGGPTDSRLPKQNASRRRWPQQHQQKSEDESSNTAEQTLPAAAVVHDNVAVEQVNVVVDPVTEATAIELQDALDRKGETGETEEEEPAPAYTKEMNHLLRRIRNNRTSMSLAAAALANPTSYQTNVLSSCQNTVKEWRSIRNHYQQDELSEETKRSTGLAVFELVQQSLQVGPLAGAKPGYFKRCGSVVASMVQQYLDELVIDQNDAVQVLCFTEKQATTIASWKSNAEKAATNTKPPSKSNMKKIDKAQKNNAKKKKQK